MLDSSRIHHPGNPKLDAHLRSHREFAANMFGRLFPNVAPSPGRFAKWMFVDAAIRYIGTQTFLEDEFLAMSGMDGVGLPKCKLSELQAGLAH